MTINLKIKQESFLSDMLTPVGAFLKLRDKFVNSLLLESSDYHGQENSFSYICCKPVAGFQFQKGLLETYLPGQIKVSRSSNDPLSELRSFREIFKFSKNTSKHIETGLFGFIAYDALAYFEEIKLSNTDKFDHTYPLIKYNLFEYVIVFDHFSNQCHVISIYNDEPNEEEFNELVTLLHKQSSPQFNFRSLEEPTSNLTDAEFLDVVKKGIHHCQIGDIFQVVFSRRFEQSFQGDEFQVYRALRSVNPSPYLFFFDYGNYKLFGSSPEAQIVVHNREAAIYPIAGTFRRTGNDSADAELANQLLEDEKENAEHVMLVDLARNDLSKFCQDVSVATYREIQFYSHVIHLVSKVTGKLEAGVDDLSILAATFPAGTLSGAPKYRAIELIDQYEKSPRGYYGGAIGFLDFEGNTNHAIMIRTFLSKDNTLSYQAGAGIVAKSVPENEVQEVYNKLEALKKAILYANQNPARK